MKKRPITDARSAKRTPAVPAASRLADDQLAAVHGGSFVINGENDESKHKPGT